MKMLSRCMPPSFVYSFKRNSETNSSPSLSDDGIPIQTSTQVAPVRQSSSPQAAPVRTENIRETSYNAILIESSPFHPTSAVKKKPVPKANTAILDQFLLSETDSDTNNTSIRRSSPSSKANLNSKKTTLLDRSLPSDDDVFNIADSSSATDHPLMNSPRQPNPQPVLSKAKQPLQDSSRDSIVVTPAKVSRNNVTSLFVPQSESPDKVRRDDDNDKRKNHIVLPSSPLRNAEYDSINDTSSLSDVIFKESTKERRLPAVSKPISSTVKEKSKTTTLTDYTFSSEGDDSGIIIRQRTPAPASRQASRPKPPVASVKTNNHTSSTSISTTTKAPTTKESRAASKAAKELARQTAKNYKQANRVTRSKEELLSEMTLDCPISIMDLFRRKECVLELDGIQIKEAPRIDTYVYWRRKVSSKYDGDTDSFQPCEEHEIVENKCCFVLTATELAEMMEMQTPLNRFIRMRTELKQFTNFIIVIVEYEQLLTKLKNRENKAYTERVRAQMNGSGDDGTTQKKRRKKTTSADDNLTLQELEETIAELQVNGFKIFPTKNAHETAVWLKSFTYAIASARYDKLERNPEFSNIGAIKSGKDRDGVYFNMLMQLKFMTEARVRRVVDTIPTFRELYDHVQRGRLPHGQDGRTVMNSNVASVVMRFLSTRDENELLHED